MSNGWSNLQLLGILGDGRNDGVTASGQNGLVRCERVSRSCSGFEIFCNSLGGDEHETALGDLCVTRRVCKQARQRRSREV